MERLYAETFACSTCFGATGCQIIPDPERVRRKVLARALNSKVFVVGQALSRTAQRKSGLPYVLPISIRAADCNSRTELEDASSR
jgi:hypothetical protein